MYDEDFDDVMYKKMVEEMTNKEYIKFVNRCLDTNTWPKAVAKEYLKKVKVNKNE